MKALIAMSGGVDSSVAAWLMKNKGYECIGATMRLFDNEEAGISCDRTCCSLDDAEDARYVCNNVGIRHYVFNFRADFRKQVIDRFIHCYEEGGTPNPCIDCNRFLKFDRLYERAKLLDCDVIVTGHYAQIERRGSRWILKKAADESKDQSYVLYTMTQEQLAHTQFPLGGLHKTQTREIAERQGFINAKKHDSQDICFVPDGDYSAAIRRFTGKEYPPGDFVDAQGNVLGRHKGIISYTIGQRKGLGLALPAPMYVLEKNVRENKVVLGKNEDLFRRELEAEDFNWIAYEEPPAELHVKARIRYNQKEQPAVVTPVGRNRIHLMFDEPQRAITPGQAVVLYDGDVVVGGGTII